MKTIDMNSNYIIICDCGHALEYEDKDLIIKEKTIKGEILYKAMVECPHCGKSYAAKAKKIDAAAFLSKYKCGGCLNDYTFKEIAEISRSGKARNYFRINEKKTITLKDGSNYDIQIIGFDHDGAGITFNFVDLIGKDNAGGHCMNESCTNVGGWEMSDMRKYLNEEFIKLLPDDLVEVLATVSKAVVDDGELHCTDDKIFLPSEIEVFGKREYSSAGEGNQYEGFIDWHNRIKGYTDADGQYGRYWWLRLPRSGYSYGFCYVDSSGNAYSGHASNGYGVSPCFAV